MIGEYVVREVTYPHPPRRVWLALTESDALAQWLLPNDFEPRLGHRFIFTAAPREGWNGIVECEVVELKALRRLAYTWCGDPDAPATVVSFTLTPVAGGTRVRLEHTVGSSDAETGANRGVPDSDAWLVRLSRLLRFQVDEVALTDALFGFLLEPGAWSANRPLLHGLEAAAPDIVPVLENMALDGVAYRPHVAHYVHALAAGLLGPAAAPPGEWMPPVTCEDMRDTTAIQRLVHRHVDEEALTETLLVYVRDPQTTHQVRHVLHTLHGVAPDLVPLLEHMILDGVTEREHVAAYVRFLSPGMSYQPSTDPDQRAADRHHDQR